MAYGQSYRGWILLATAIVGGCGSSDCTDMDCSGRAFEVALLDADDAPAASARGEIEYSSHSGARPFDCTILPGDAAGDIDCTDGALQLPPVYNPDDELRIRFEREDGTLTDWQPVELTIERKVLTDFNGPGCDCTTHRASADPVIVPAL